MTTAFGLNTPLAKINSRASSGITFNCYATKTYINNSGTGIMRQGSQL